MFYSTHRSVSGPSSEKLPLVVYKNQDRRLQLDNVQSERFLEHPVLNEMSLSNSSPSELKEDVKEENE